TDRALNCSIGAAPPDADRVGQQAEISRLGNGPARGIDDSALEDIEVSRRAEGIGEPSQLFRSPAPLLGGGHPTECGNRRSQPTDSYAHLVDSVGVAGKGGCLIAQNLIEAVTADSLEGFRCAELRTEIQRFGACSGGFFAAPGDQFVPPLSLASR